MSDTNSEGMQQLNLFVGHFSVYIILHNYVISRCAVIIVLHALQFQMQVSSLTMQRSNSLTHRINVWSVTHYLQDDIVGFFSVPGS